MDELQQNLQQHFSRTAQVSFGGFPIYPNPCIIEDLEALLRGGVLGVSGGLRDWRTVTPGLDASLEKGSGTNSQMARRVLCTIGS